MQISNNHFFNPIKLKHSIKQVTKRNVNETSVSNVKFPEIDEYYVRKRDNSSIADCELRGWVSSFTNHSKYAFVVLVGDSLPNYDKFVVEKKNRKNNRR